MSDSHIPSSAKPDTEPTLLEMALHFLAILLKYRWLVIIVTLVGALGSVAFSIVSIVLPPEKSPLPNRYTANATLFVQKGMGENLSTSILAALGMQTVSTDTSGGFETGSLLVSVLKSRTLLDKVIEEFDLAKRYGFSDQLKSRVREALLEKSNFAYTRSTATVSISFEDIDPVLARDVTNRMVSLLNEWYLQNIGSTSLRQKQLLEEKLKEVKSEVDSLESKQKELQRKYGVLGAQDLGTSQATALAQLRSQLILKEIEIKNYSAIAAIEDPKLTQLREERQNILDLISQTQQSPTNLPSGGSGQKSLPDIQLEFNNLTVEMDIQRQIYNTLSQQYEVLKLTAEPDSAFQVMELAEIPDYKSGPSRSRIVVIAAAAAFFGSSALAFLLHSLARLKRKRTSAPAQSPKAI